MKKYSFALTAILTVFSLSLAHADDTKEEISGENLEKIAEYAGNEAVKSVESKKYKFLKKAIAKYNTRKHDKLKTKVLNSELTDDQKALALTVLDEIRDEKLKQDAE